MNIFDEFSWRGMLYDATEGLDKVFATEKVTAYIGFDPSASSLHVGSLLPVMALARLQRSGHKPIAIVGGGTGLIGDPSGKSQERMLLTKEQVAENLEGIREQLSRFLDFDAQENSAEIISNADWLVPTPLMDFLRDVGKHFTVNYMLSKESVSRRLEQEQGISYTEFSYMLLQAYDFLVLNERYNCVLQMGGSDQWGNILAGIELIRRARKTKAHGLVFPLVMDSSGVKFGKSEAGENIWLDEKRTQPYRFFQYWLNTDDKDVITYLKYFTWLNEDEIKEQEELIASAPEKREAQRTLARHVTAMVHGEAVAERAEQASRKLFNEDLSAQSVQSILDSLGDVPSITLERSLFEGDGIGIVDLLILSNWPESEDSARDRITKAEARRLIQNGGLYLNNRRITDGKRRVSLADFLERKILVLRKGQKQYHLISLQGNTP
jgi:tyrosyl-tRNA synthetase